MNSNLYIKNPWWEKEEFFTGVDRAVYVNEIIKNVDNQLIHVLTGLRRVGKSTIALQSIKALIKKKKISSKRILYFSIEDPSISGNKIIDIINEFRAEFELKRKERIFVFIDEIQFRDGWEKEIKSLYDSENIKFILTGSSTLLISEKISYLTGRFLKTEILPLNFAEYLMFLKNDKKIKRADEHLWVNYVQNYLQTGGMPEYVLRKPDRYLQTTVESILFKDLVTKYQLRNPVLLQDLIFLLSDRVGSTTSSLKIANILELNKDTVLTYVDYLNKVYLTTELDNYSTSRNKQMYNPPKIYFSDNGILNVYASKANIGALAENAVFNKLSSYTRKTDRVKIGYWSEKGNEVDFIINYKNSIFAIESKWVDEIEDIDFTSLNIMAENLPPTKVLIVSRSLRTSVIQNGIKYVVVPLHEFLNSDISELISIITP